MQKQGAIHQRAGRVRERSMLALMRATWRWPWWRPVPSHSPLACVDTAPWPLMTVLLLARERDTSLSACLQALLASAYPTQSLHIVPICDQADAHASAVIKAYAHLFPERVRPCYRSGAQASADAALREALPLVQGDLLVVFDSRQRPGPGLFKQLARPFFDPEVGMVMGETNVNGASSLAAVRLSAIEAAGGLGGNSLSDVDAGAQRLRAAGWTCVLNPQARCVDAPTIRPAAVQQPVAPPAAEPRHDMSALKNRVAPVLAEHT